MSDEDKNEKPATEQFEDDPDPEHDEVASGEHDESSSENGEDDEPATAKFDEASDEQHDGPDADSGRRLADESEADEQTDIEVPSGDTATADEQLSDEDPGETATRAEGVTDAEAADVESREKHVVTGGEFERELDLDRETTADFLEDLAHQLRAGTSLTVSGDDWEIPFEYAEPIEVEVEYEGDEDEERELEIEIEFEWGGDGDNLEVE